MLAQLPARRETGYPGPVRLGWFWVLAGCGPTPVEVVTEAAVRWQGAPAALARFLDPDYRDGRGDGAQLLADTAAWDQQYAQRSLRLEELHEGTAANELEKRVLGRFTLVLVGSPPVEASGTWQVVLRRRADGYRILDGWLPEPREILAIMAARREALEANDAEALRPLLHPKYRDGLMDSGQAISRLDADLKGISLRLTPTRYWIELRGAQAHVDEHYQLTLNGRAAPPGVARFTLGKSAGRWRILAGLYGNEGNGALEPQDASD